MEIPEIDSNAYETYMIKATSQITGAKNKVIKRTIVIIFGSPSYLKHLLF